MLPSRVTIVEVGPRDGLQNEAQPIPTGDKLAFIERLADAGLRFIEATSFVSPKRIPQLADAAEVAAKLPSRAGVTYSALVPNAKGLERAIEAKIPRIAVFTAASETFTQKNIGMSIEQSLDGFREVVAAARARGMTARGYVSTCFVCPYEGEVAPDRVRDVAASLLALGVDEVSLGDTIGAAAPRDVERVIERVAASVPREKIALHFHDTYGTALANVHAGLQLGIGTFDSSAGGLGGCPYAPGASGNLATEDLVYFLDRMGIWCGVDLRQIASASVAIEKVLGRSLPSKQLQRIKSTRA
ncbi:MAG: hydroxymethylglutaryl-CoA lyase [Planctomycetes bacterium]|nr:hydroxymethylglutaryl-CoA lyase [Planctomycetota bacterium]MBI3844859.1 hydroxymethylglutaryl-CoA lyase [Planctomycetota bacterium]